MINIFTDGACEPNPGIGGWAFVVVQDGVETEFRTGGHPSTTNNVMEMTAVLGALEYAEAKRFSPDSVTVHSDSQYVVNGCNVWRHGWKTKGWKRGVKPLANDGLWKALDSAADTFPCRIEWVRGHAGNIWNERADELASEARIVTADLFPAGFEAAE